MKNYNVFVDALRSIIENAETIPSLEGTVSDVEFGEAMVDIFLEGKVFIGYDPKLGDLVFQYRKPGGSE